MVKRPKPEWLISSSHPGFKLSSFPILKALKIRFSSRQAMRGIRNQH